VNEEIHGLFLGARIVCRDRLKVEVVYTEDTDTYGVRWYYNAIGFGLKIPGATARKQADKYGVRHELFNNLSREYNANVKAYRSFAARLPKV
jgi:hypothetical protein